MSDKEFSVTGQSGVPFKIRLRFFSGFHFEFGGQFLAVRALVSAY
jgi:hypothetical protein